MSNDKVSDVFKSTGQPTITYVQRDSGAFERRLKSALDEGGQIALVTGPSKTGKTTLYKRVLEGQGSIPLVVQCRKDRSASEIWKAALEAVKFDQTVTVTATSAKSSKMTAEVSGEASWAWLAKIIGKGVLSREDSSNEVEVRQSILAQPSADTLIPLLQNTNLVLVIEDFHYLEDDQKILLFQQWKRFIDSEISIVVLGTSHRAVDIANSNKDLVGRIVQIDIEQWSKEDLKKICVLGFEHLQADVTETISNLIAQESVGLPIIAQQICLELFNRRNVFSIRDARKKKLKLTESEVRASLHDVAKLRYTQFDTYYQTLVRGPREKARVYKTYELVLACFTVDPILFALSRAEIDRRLDKLSISTKERPPAASVNSTLGALSKFQETRNFRLLEWRVSENMLYIVEPSFLFFVRWRNLKDEPEQLSFLEQLFISSDELSAAIKKLAR